MHQAKRDSGIRVAQDGYRMSSWQTVLNIGGKACDPFDTRCGYRPSQVGRHGNDPVPEVFISQIKLYGLGIIFPVHDADGLPDQRNDLLPLNADILYVIVVDI
jgi:hypothetical protein